MLTNNAFLNVNVKMEIKIGLSKDYVEWTSGVDSRE